MKVLVTGGAGFIGSHVVDRLIEKGYSVAVVDSLGTGKRENVHEKARFYHGDIKDRPFLEEVFQKEKPSIVMHLAAQKSVSHSVADPIYDAHENILGSLHLAEVAREYHAKRIVFASTGGALYGETEEIPTGEDHKTFPESPYGIAKLSIEHYLRFYANVHEFTATILRMANVYGPRQDPHGEAGVVAIFCEKALKGEPVTVYGDGKQTRDYVYVKDVARAFVRVLDDETGGTFNIGTGVETSVLDLVAALNHVTKKKAEVKFLPASPGELRRSALSAKRAQEQFEWEPRTTLEEGVRETYSWFKSQEKDK